MAPASPADDGAVATRNEVGFAAEDGCVEVAGGPGRKAGRRDFVLGINVNRAGRFDEVLDGVPGGREKRADRDDAAHRYPEAPFRERSAGPAAGMSNPSSDCKSIAARA